MYHASKLDKLQIEKLPCCSSSLHFHILRAHRQCYTIRNCLSQVELPPENYGFDFDTEDGYVPRITSSHLPEDFPTPCTCGKCTKKTVCPCRVNGRKCSDFCRCKGNCRNPLKWIGSVICGFITKFNLVWLETKFSCFWGGKKLKPRRIGSYEFRNREVCSSERPSITQG